jgi:hypothetical protein
MQVFGDGFDLYNDDADAQGYWDGNLISNNFNQNAASRFGVGQSLASGGGTGAGLYKSSGANDAVHHFNVAYMQTATVSGSTNGFIIQISDVAAVQCTVQFRTDGAITLCSGAAGGTVLATYTGAFTAPSAWYSYEIEVVINNTTGSFIVRANGSPSNSFSATGLNTRAGSANNYANRIALGAGAFVSNFFIDDFLWRSDPTSVPWIGDVRCYTRMPTIDQTVQFSRGQSSVQVILNGVSGVVPATTINTILFVPFTCPTNTTGAILSLVNSINSNVTGHANMAIYDSTGTGGAPGNLVTNGTATAVTNPLAGNVVYTFATPPVLTRGGSYYAALNSDVAMALQGPNTVSAGMYTLAQTYTGSFPSSAAGAAAVTPRTGWTYLFCNVVPLNAFLVSDAPQTALTTYVYDSTVGHADFYGLSPLSGVTPPSSVIAVTVRSYMQKSDAGFRQAATQLKSGATTVAAPTITLTTGWNWSAANYLNDPNTSAPWTTAAVDAVQFGPTVIA